MPWGSALVLGLFDVFIDDLDDRPVYPQQACQPHKIEGSGGYIRELRCCLEGP